MFSSSFIIFKNTCSLFLNIFSILIHHRAYFYVTFVMFIAYQVIKTYEVSTMYLSNNLYKINKKYFVVTFNCIYRASIAVMYKQIFANHIILYYGRYIKIFHNENRFKFIILICEVIFNIAYIYYMISILYNLYAFGNIFISAFKIWSLLFRDFICLDTLNMTTYDFWLLFLFYIGNILHMMKLSVLEVFCV